MKSSLTKKTLRTFCFVALQCPKANLIAVMLLVPALQAVSQSDDIERIIAKYDDIQSSREYSEFYRSLFTACEPSELAALNSNANDSIATQSAWEIVTMTVPKEDGPNVYRPEAFKLAWFVGFFEGRNRVTTPAWWRTVVLDARANRRNNIYPGEPNELPYHRSKIKGVACPTHATVTQADHVVTYRTSNDSIVIPEVLLDRASDGDLWCNISCAFTKKHCFAAIHDDVGYPHNVACIDRETGKILWKSKACGCWWGAATGRHESWVAVMPTDGERVVIFGSASTGFYSHGFDARTGSTLFRFSNNY